MPSTTKTRSKLAAAALLLACMTAPGSVPARADDAAVAVVERTTSGVIAILTDQKLSTDEKRKRVEDVVLQSVDFETLSKLVLARNWTRFSDPQRTEFLSLFRNHLSMTYGRNVEGYKNEKVTITGSRAETGGDSTVKTKILRGGPGDVMIDYRLRQRDGQWKIIDVIIEGVSLVSNFRSQFQDVVSGGGPEKLLELLREKNVKGEPLKSR
ncbi:MAG: ABC transporter substrate-binding protein [Candidatus Binatia bacterium]